jgi:EVE domain-containing protein
MSGNWIVVASAEHVQRGREAGFMQANHGKAAPLRRVRPGDRVACYSPTAIFGGKDKLQAFTAIGVLSPGEPYQVDMGNGFRPFRRDVTWLAARQAPIAPLLEVLEFSAGIPNWGYKLRLGLFAISDQDMRRIAEAMGVQLPA